MYMYVHFLTLSMFSYNATLPPSLAKGSATQVRRHRFSPMFSNERKLIHELAPHYGCDSLSHDTEPQRYVTLSTKK